MLVSLNQILAEPLGKKDKRNTSEETKKDVKDRKLFPEEMDLPDRRKKTDEENERRYRLGVFEYLHLIPS
jgi:hypothetical protein